MQKNYFRYLIPLLVVIMLILTACETADPTIRILSETNSVGSILVETTANATDIPKPASDMTRVCGRIVDPEGQSVESIVVFFPEVYYGDGNEEGAFVLNTAASPSAVTDSDGYFCTREISVMNYILVIGSPDAEYEIYSVDGQKAIVWEPEEGQVLDIGEISTTIRP